MRASLLDVTGPKRTALGEGWFVTTRSTWYAGEEPVAAMDFRILKFRPQPRPATSAASPVMRPQVSPDTAFFWAGTAAGELRIQRCGKCGALRHPPGPMCPRCRVPQRPAGGETGYAVAAGTGEVYSYVVHHHPPVPGKTLPLVIALVELPEGVRMVGELLGVRPGPGADRPAGPGRVRPRRRRADPAGLAARRSARRRGPSRPAGHARRAEPGPGPPEPALPELAVEATPTFVISSALATRDFQDVHHDRDLAIARGSQDIFINILTTTGLVQRFVSGWAGPQARVQVDLHPARGAVLRRRHADLLRSRERGRRPRADGHRHRAVPPRRSRHRHGPRRAARERLMRTAAIAGIGATEFSKNSGRSELQLAAEATAAALADAGLSAVRGGRAGHVHHGQQRRDRAGP